MNATIAKHSIAYGYALSQPFAMYIDAYPMFQEILAYELKGLQYGSNSDTVLLLQKKLNNLGYYNDKLDGDYGLLTEHAVKNFQAEHKILITGTMNQETVERLAINEVTAKVDKINRIIQDVSFGDVNEEVTILQEQLFYLGYYKSMVDGIYGPLTDQAIIAFQGELLDESRFLIKQAEISLEKEVVDLATKMSRKEGIKDIEEMTLKTVPENVPTNKTEVAPPKVAAEETHVEKISTEQPVQLNIENSTQEIIELAESLLGTSYVWGGTSTSGFDCSGFIQYVYKQNDIVVPRTVSDIWNFSSPVDSPAIGDLVFFETYKTGPSHLGIYLGNGNFIHCGSSSGVSIANLKDHYWESRYLGAKRI